MKSHDLLQPRIETIVPKTPQGFSTFEANLAKMPAGSQIEIVFSKLGRPIPGILRLIDIITANGKEPIPHISARGLEEGELRPFLQKLADAHVREVLVVGGDPNPSPGPYTESMQVLKEIVKHNKGSSDKIETVGLAGHPDGHPQATIVDIRKKVMYLSNNGISPHVQTQPATPGTLITYAQQLIEAGIDAPVLAGVFGPGTATDYINMTKTIGVKKSTQFLRQNPQVMLAAVLSTIEAHTSGHVRAMIKGFQDKLRYGPENLIHDISSHPDLGATKITGIYLFSLKNFGKSVDFYVNHSQQSS